MAYLNFVRWSGVLSAPKENGILTVAAGSAGARFDTTVSPTASPLPRGYMAMRAWKRREVIGYVAYQREMTRSRSRGNSIFHI